MRLTEQQYPFLDLIPAAIFVADFDGRIAWWNSSSQELTGYAFAEVWGKCVWDLLLAPDEIGRLKRAFANLESGESTERLEGRWLTKTGEHRWVSSVNRTVRYPDGHRAIVGVGVDITERVRARAS